MIPRIFTILFFLLITNISLWAQSTKYDFTRTPASLNKSFDMNGVRALLKYQKKRIKITGYINEISRDAKNRIYVKLTADRYNNQPAVSCLFDEKMLGTIIKLNKGKFLSIVGAFVRQDLEDKQHYILHDCVILKEKPKETVVKDLPDPEENTTPIGYNDKEKEYIEYDDKPKTTSNTDAKVGGRQIIKKCGSDYKKGVGWTDSGNAVVRICVNERGYVISADFVERKSTITSRTLINRAINCAKQYRYESQAGAEDMCGEIVIQF